ncbi:MAG: ParB/RepB/Spo0J family partition protein [Deltaproteobacteria bacterium]
MVEKRGLGRGLSALMADVGLDKPKGEKVDGQPRQPDRMIPIEKIHANRTQPRKDFAPDALQELADSIKARGIIQPLVLRPMPGTPGDYEIVAGERRWRASQIAQLHELPAVIRELTDMQVFELALIENIQRQELNAFEEAAAYSRLQEDYGHTQEDISNIVGKSRSHVANMLRLLNLPDSVLYHLRAGDLSAGHAKVLMGAKYPKDMAEIIVERQLSVRQAEDLISKTQKSNATKVLKEAGFDPDAEFRDLEQEVSAALNMKVKISFKGEDKGGSITVSYKSLDEFDALMRRMGLEVDRG